VDLAGGLRFHALVLAAGFGSRFGGGKLLAPWRGGALIDGALDAAFAAPVEDVWVVVGADPAVAARALSRPAVQVVQANDYTSGMSASLKAGVAALPADAAGVLIFLGDMPLIPHAVLAPLVRAVAEGAPAAVPIWQGRQGHPAALSRRLFPLIQGLKGDRGARAVLDGLGDTLALIPSPDSGVLLDVDHPGDMPA
jgi:molybdenum cofactor cytidylyltransferase